MPDAPALEAAADGLRVRVRVITRADREAFVGAVTDAQGVTRLSVRVRAVSSEDEANAATERLIARETGAPRSRVWVEDGLTHPNKIVHITASGAQRDTALEALKRLLSKGAA